jgi:hypothetical protein
LLLFSLCKEKVNRKTLSSLRDASAVNSIAGLCFVLVFKNVCTPTPIPGVMAFCYIGNCVIILCEEIQRLLSLRLAESVGQKETG